MDRGDEDGRRTGRGIDPTPDTGCQLHHPLPVALTILLSTLAKAPHLPRCDVHPKRSAGAAGPCRVRAEPDLASAERPSRLCERPIEPGKCRLQIGGLHGRATPQPQARRRVAVAAGIEGGRLVVQGPGE